MALSPVEVLPVVLLTGAGFTKNFGGYLASEMLNEIRNKASALLRNWIDNRTPSNFEGLYDEALKSGDKQLVEDMNVAVRNSFKGMDAQIRDRIKRGPYDNAIRNPPNVFGQFISQFAGEQHESRSFWFTLNQDLFVERAWNSGSRKINIRIPGLENGNWFAYRNREYDTFSDELRVRLPENPVAEFKEDGRRNPFDGAVNFIYIKLHGSVNWQSHDGGDCLVIGTRKSEQAKNEPILDQYFDVFEKVLCRTDCTLLVIGYSFGDAHINEVICKAIVHSGIKVFVSNYMRCEKLKVVLQDVLLPDDTKVDLGTQSAGEAILSATDYVEPQPITDFYVDQYEVTGTGKELLHRLEVLNY
ncbi:SIR2 family protein [Acidobacteria bacterium AH-259-L09]|nr:SIR2 family protein [Acidobacteria bacterium AH-259-L09]